MKISATELQSVIAVYRAGGLARSGGSAAVLDAAEISYSGAALSAIRLAYDRLPDVREERVRDLRRRVREGKYYVPTEEIVEKILGRLTVDSLF
ncbi:MAG TPA: flagellar biosynthesis anti-sigma factor FlgM [Candidatus Dormibacteraeota bacterium]|nr:flagellar biosynthesis anti-sigma factor FlgM [Candidatus Dormibacteraeota bacterium]